MRWDTDGNCCGEATLSDAMARILDWYRATEGGAELAAASGSR